MEAVEHLIEPGLRQSQRRVLAEKIERGALPATRRRVDKNASTRAHGAIVNSRHKPVRPVFSQLQNP
ncbi:hypothetical protein BDIM_06150 [Brevundimonas diminuta ATCC 11568]|nr:hypothetical protein BDIM_06150 [Brevundimonas diminuta ATCC 11568]